MAKKKISGGKEEDLTSKAYIFATYYTNGAVYSCTFGFQTNNIPMFITDKTCGDNINDIDASVAKKMIVTNGLIGYWHYKQGVVGSTWTNVSPNTVSQYNGLINGATLQSDGMYFNGGVWVTVQNFPRSHYNFSTEVVLSLNTIKSHNIMGLDSNYRLWYSALSNQGVAVSYDNEITSTEGKSTSFHTFNGNQTYTVTTTWNTNLNGRSRIYINGQLIKDEYIGKRGWFSSTGELFIGSTYASGNLDGKIKSVKFYNRELSADEVKQNHEVGVDDVGL